MMFQKTKKKNRNDCANLFEYEYVFNLVVFVAFKCRNNKICGT